MFISAHVSAETIQVHGYVYIGTFFDRAGRISLSYRTLGLAIGNVSLSISYPAPHTSSSRDLFSISDRPLLLTSERERL